MLGLLIASTLAVAAFAAEMQRVSAENSKEQPYSVFIRSGNEVIAELKLTKPGTLNVEGGEVAYRLAPGGGKDINSTRGSKLEFLVEGKSVLTVSGDSMTIQNSRRK